MSMLHAHTAAVFRCLADISISPQLLGLLAAACACLLAPRVKPFTSQLARSLSGQMPSSSLSCYVPPADGDQYSSSRVAGVIKLTLAIDGSPRECSALPTGTRACAASPSLYSMWVAPPRHALLLNHLTVCSCAKDAQRRPFRSPL